MKGDFTKLKNSSDDSFGAAQDFEVYKCLSVKFNDRKQFILKNGLLELTMDKTTFSTMGGIEISSNFTVTKEKLHNWIIEKLEIKSAKNKKEISQGQVKKNLKIKRAYLRESTVGNSSQKKEKIIIELEATKWVAQQLLKKRTGSNFKGNSLDWKLPFSKTTLTRLNMMKNENPKIIGSWFVTPGGANLVICPINTNNERNDEKSGILLKNPDSDVFVKVNSFDDMKKFKQKNAYVKRNGMIDVFDPKKLDFTKNS